MPTPGGVQEGEVEDPTFLPVLLEPPAGFDWRDPEVWAYVNPALGVFRSLEEMQTSAKRAEHVPTQQAAFRQLYLKEWRDGSAEPWLDLAVWDEGEAEVEPQDGDRCWIGVDLASVSDLAAVVAVWPHEDGYFCKPAFFCPAEGIRRRSERDGVPYALWAEQGHLVATPGSVIDYGYIEAYIADLAERYRVQVIIDRWNSTSTTTRLGEAGIDCVTMGQGYASLSPAMKETERLILARQITHDGNPILRWNLGNVAAAQDPAGNMKPDRARSRDKIDGVLGLIMAIGVASASPAGSIYESRPSFLYV
jgi:phage terminase large subunit-like protein